jgi:3-hydroxyisobutyrate dehydrogenase-like beta-hydroxyacid dehydrogenase
MAEIAFIGLGLMGSALAEAAQTAGRELTVWNRSAHKAKPFADAGIAVAKGLPQALHAAPIAVICISTFSEAKAMLSTDEAKAAMRDRVIVHLSSSTPNEADTLAAWCRDQGALYLDGAILGSPSAVREGTAQILLAGSAEAFARAEPFVTAMGAMAKKLGPNVREPSVLDMAWLMQWYGLFIAGAQVAAICESENVDLIRYIEIDSNDLLKRFLSDLQNGGETPRAAALSVWAQALENIRDHGRERGANTEFPDLMGSLFERAIKAGYGAQDVVALAKVLRPQK